MAALNPPDSIVKSALQLKIELTQRKLDSFLDLDEVTTEVGYVKIDSRINVDGDDDNIFLVSGYSDVKFSANSRIVNTPFSLFLVKGEKGESWSLAIKNQTSNEPAYEWITYPLPIDSDLK